MVNPSLIDGLAPRGTEVLVVVPVTLTPLMREGPACGGMVSAFFFDDLGELRCKFARTDRVAVFLDGLARTTSFTP